MEIYQTHHISMAEALAKLPIKSEDIVSEILKNEEGRCNNPINKENFIKEIAKAIDNTRNGIKMETLGIDFPHTGLETDPICRSCRQCPTIKNREEVENFYRALRKRS
jgi:hypothetical protein